MIEVLITEFMAAGAVERLSRVHETLYEPTLVDERPRLLASLPGTRALVVRNRTQVDSELLEAGPDLEVVGRLGVGLDNIDLDACTRRGVVVRPATGANSVAVAEYVIGALLTLRRGVFGATGRLLDGEWPRTELTGGELAGLRLGLAGLGDIARKVALRARAFDMKVIAHDPYLPSSDPAWDLADPVDLDQLVTTADAVSLHVPLLPETRNLFDRAALSSMKPGALLVNTARGGIVDEEALADSLRSGHLGGAALDVFAAEPPDTSAIDRFRGVDRLILTPHIAGVTAESNERVSHVVADAVLEELARR